MKVLASIVDEVMVLDAESSIILKDALRCLASKVRALIVFYRMLVIYQFKDH